MSIFSFLTIENRHITGCVSWLAYGPSKRLLSNTMAMHFSVF